MPRQAERFEWDYTREASRFSLRIQEFFLSKRGAGECSFFFERFFFLDFSS
jgi:hypothetical protein